MVSPISQAFLSIPTSSSGTNACQGESLKGRTGLTFWIERRLIAGDHGAASAARHLHELRPTQAPKKEVSASCKRFTSFLNYASDQGFTVRLSIRKFGNNRCPDSRCVQHFKCCSGEGVPQAAGARSASWLMGQNAARTTDNTPEASEVVRRHARRSYHFTRAAPFTCLAGSCHEQQELKRTRRTVFPLIRIVSYILLCERRAHFLMEAYPIQTRIFRPLSMSADHRGIGRSGCSAWKRKKSGDIDCVQMQGCERD